MTELYQNAVTAAGITVFPNPNLKPEQSLASELAIERKFADGRVRLSLFNEYTSDLLIAQPITLPGITAAQQVTTNVDKVRNRGVELASQKDNVIERVDVFGSITYVDSVILSDPTFVGTNGSTAVGKRVPYVPMWRTTLGGTYRPDDHWALDGRRALSKQGLCDARQHRHRAQRLPGVRSVHRVRHPHRLQGGRTRLDRLRDRQHRQLQISPLPPVPAADLRDAGPASVLNEAGGDWRSRAAQNGRQTMRPTVFFALLAFALLGGAAAFAQSPDQAAIVHLMHRTFDKPESPLTVAPVVVAGDHALAGWTQGDMGGRALLRRKGQNWSLILCAGDGIKSRDALHRAGIPIGDATTLERELAKAELALPPQHIAMFSRFEGMLMMDESGQHPPAGHGHGTKH